MFYDDAARIELVGSHLLAQIPDDQGRMMDTQLDLNDCIGNQNGRRPVQTTPTLHTAHSHLLLYSVPLP